MAKFTRIILNLSGAASSGRGMERITTLASSICKDMSMNAVSGRTIGKILKSLKRY
jgi:hypothetical protein